MASFSVPCSMISVLSVSSSHSSSTHQPHVSVSLRSGPALLPRIQGSSRHQSQVFKVNAQLNEVIRSGDGFEEELSNYLSTYFKGETFEEESSNDLAGDAFEEKLSNYFKGETFEEESSNDFEGEGFEGELPNDFEGEAFEEELSNYFKGETFEEESSNDFEGEGFEGELPNDHAGGLSRASDFANDLAGETLEGESSGETRKYGHLWVVCENCYTLNYKKYFLEKMYICEGCGSHVPMHSSDRIELLIDPGSWEPMYEGIFSLDPIEFHSEEDPYKDRIDYYQRETGLTEAVQTGIGQLNGIPIALGVMDFRFIGGSMGSVVGERITRLVEHAANQNLPLILVCASGGARMQEGSLSLMQMAKISSALYDYQSNKKLLYISILTSPTTGGVTASFGMLGDIVIAEPNAYIAFAGKRVIEETLNIIVPEGVQETEYLFEKGSFDLIVPRKLLKSTLSELFELHGYVSFESKVKQNQVEH